jgi:hypothetical protein
MLWILFCLCCFIEFWKRVKCSFSMQKLLFAYQQHRSKCASFPATAKLWCYWWVAAISWCFWDTQCSQGKAFGFTVLWTNSLSCAELKSAQLGSVVSHGGLPGPIIIFNVPRAQSKCRQRSQTRWFSVFICSNNGQHWWILTRVMCLSTLSLCTSHSTSTDPSPHFAEGETLKHQKHKELIRDGQVHGRGDSGPGELTSDPMLTCCPVHLPHLSSSFLSSLGDCHKSRLVWHSLESSRGWEQCLS